MKLTTKKYPFLSFETKEGKKSFFDYKDGKWQFWGDADIDESAKMLFESLSSNIEEYFNKELIEKYKETIKQNEINNQ